MPPVPESEEQAVHRLRHVVRAGVVWIAIVVARLVYLQVICHGDYVQQALQQQERQIEIPAPRGAILDATGQPLAMSLPVDSVCVNPMRIRDFAVASQLLARTLDLDAADLQAKLKLAADTRRGFLWIKRKISPEESRSLRSYDFDWVEYRQESRRFYPKGPLGSHLVGSVDYEEKGNSGLEMSLNDELEGHPGVMTMQTDVKQRGWNADVFTKPMPGTNLTLTIDERIQFVAERELKAAVEANNCKTGSLVAMDPKTGEILALANYPAFDPNEPLRPDETLADRNNLAVSVPFEPGSVFKVITLSAALETTNLRPESVIPCGNGVIKMAGRVIHDHNAYAALSMADVLAKSSNIGAIQIGMRVGEQNLLDYVLRFGFGKATGLPLPAESSGVVRPLSQWGGSSIGSVAMGHEISTTTVQLARACSVIANGGFLVKPRIIKSRQRPGGPVEPEPAAGPATRVLRPDTVMTMRTMMEGVVLHGTGTMARLDRYTAAGKTGTAQIFDLSTHQYTHKYNSSFMGFAPVANPAIVVVATLNGATKYGGPVAAPVFHQVAQAALRILDVPKDLPGNLAVEEQEETPVDDLAIPDLGASTSALAEVLGGQRGSLTGARPSTLALLTPVSSDPAVQIGPTVPDFRGKTLRAVIEQTTSSGLPVEFTGNGIARRQYPMPGAVLPPGERVRVQFVR